MVMVNNYPVCLALEARMYTDDFIVTNLRASENLATFHRYVWPLEH